MAEGIYFKKMLSGRAGEREIAAGLIVGGDLRAFRRGQPLQECLASHGINLQVIRYIHGEIALDL